MKSGSELHREILQSDDRDRRVWRTYVGQQVLLHLRDRLLKRDDTKIG